MKNRHAERLTRDVLLTLSSGSNLFYDPFLEFPCVALALVHFSTLLSLCYYYFFFFFPLFLLQLLRYLLFYFACIDDLSNRKIRSFRDRQVKIACNETSNVSFFFFLTQKLQPAFTANFVDFFFFFSLTSIFQYFENDCCAIAGVNV